MCGDSFFFFKLKGNICHCREASAFLDPTESMETVEEQRTHSPPASLVPRLHMLYAEPLQHNNPLLPSAVSEEKGACKTVSGFHCFAMLCNFTRFLTCFLSFFLNLFFRFKRSHKWDEFSQSWAARLPQACFPRWLTGCRVPHSSSYLERVSGS